MVTKANSLLARRDGEVTAPVVNGAGGAGSARLRGADMSFWNRLFGGKAAEEPGPAKPAAEIEYRGYTVRAEPYPVEGGQYQTAGTVVKSEGDTLREHRFVRADRFATLDDATEFSLRKGRQLVDEQGDRMFG
jgi:hypothetical protein